MTIAEYILQKLKENGCYHVIGIPGTSCAGFFESIDQDNEVEYVVTTNELEAGYIADGYGRSGGFGAVCVSYGVGTLSLVNAIASAFTERVPVIIINGGPTQEDLRIERELGSLFSHSTGGDQTDLNIFRQITVFSEILNDLAKTKEYIDVAFFKAKIEQRPVYLEIPQDCWDKKISEETFNLPQETHNASVDFIREAEIKISAAKSPILFIGVEIVRKQLRDKILTLIDNWNIPFVTTVLAKSYLPESHPNFIGTYDSDLFHKKDLFQIIDDSDCPISFGCIWGIDHREYIKRKYNSMIDVAFNKARVSTQYFSPIAIESVIDTFIKWSIKTSVQIPQKAVAFNTSDEFGHDQIFSTINNFLKSTENIQVVLDTCLGSFPGADLQMPNTDMYLANPVWLSIGQGTPAAIGAYLKNRKHPIIISGDGGFQMVAQSYSTMVKYCIPALIIILDNSLYAIEQYLIDSSYFNENKPPLKYVELNRWAYEKFPLVFNGGYGKRIYTEKELVEVLDEWQNTDNKNQPWIISCEISKKNLPSK